MSGEQLMCVWDAVAVLDVEKDHATAAPKCTVKTVTSSLEGLQSVHYSENAFEETFQKETVTLQQYKNYVKQSLREKGVSLAIVRDHVEQFCWNLVKGSYKSCLHGNEVEKLWKICNRLLVEDTYPPTMCKEEACWITDRILTNVGNVLKSGDDMFKEDKISFKKFLSTLEDNVFKLTTQEKIRTCLDDLYSWLVLEVFKKAKAYVRSKKRSNWSMWSKRCCFLTPKSIIVHNEGLDKMDITGKRAELVFTKNTKTENLPMYNGIIHHLKGRFRIANFPVTELEIAVEDDGEKRAWLAQVEDIIACIKENTTPVQKLLRKRFMKRKRKTDENNFSFENVEKTLDSCHAQTTKGLTRDLSSNQNGGGEVATVSKPQPVSPEITLSKPQLVSSEVEYSMYDSTVKTKNMIDVNLEKLKAVFMKIDSNGNGMLDQAEFSKFIRGIGLRLGDKETNLVFKMVDSKNKGQITFSQFETYFSKYVLDENSSVECVNAIRKAFLEADRDGSGTLNFREFTEYIWEKKRSIRMSKILTSFSTCDKDEITFTDFQRMVASGNTPEILNTIAEEGADEESDFGNFQNQLKQVYDETETEELASYIRDRWQKFATFRRVGHTGSLVMKGGHGMVADFVPGEYSLIDMTCFSDLPPLVPKHTVIKEVKWVPSTIAGVSGKVSFPSDFDGNVVTDIATSELLRYYGCSFADAKQEKISLLYRHGIQDFTYENGYLEKYVTSANGGSGIERHEFSHLDCPLSEDSGIFILAKFTEDDEFHITGFKIPIRHTLYIPSGCIHSNDYLRGTWRTMLSDETDIDHVHLARRIGVDEEYDNVETKFCFKFV